MSNELRLIHQRVERLEAAVGDIRDRLRNCVLVAPNRWEDAIGLARGVAELLAKQVQKDIGRKPDAMLDACLKDLEKDEVRSRGLVPAEILSYFRLAQILGNKGVHDAMKIDPTASTVVSVLHAVLEIVHWYFCTFDRGPKLASVYTPDPDHPTPSTQPPTGSRLFQLPAVVADFTGREPEFERMVLRLCAEAGAVGLVAVRGMGGVGKTSLAVKVAHQVKLRFPDAQLVLRLRVTADGVKEHPATPAELMGDVIHAFHPDEKLPDSFADVERRYLSVLTGKRALILLDNAKDESQVKPLLSAGAPAAFLITSRKTLRLSNVDVVPLDVLSAEEAFALLRGIVGDAKGTDPELREVAKLAGYLPLAVRVAGDFLRTSPTWTLPRYIKAIQDEKGRLERLKGLTDGEDVEAVLGLSAAELVRTDPERAGRWQMLSAFPAGFDLEAAGAVWDLRKERDRVLGGWILAELIMQDVSSSTNPAAKQVFGRIRFSLVDKDAASKELDVLQDRSLIQFDPVTKRFSLHDLMRPVARDAFQYAVHDTQWADRVNRLLGWSARIATERNADPPSGLRTAERRFAAHYCDILCYAARCCQTGYDLIQSGRWQFEEEIENIRHGQRWATEHYLDDPIAAKLCRDYPASGAHAISLWLPLAEQVAWLNAAVEACRRLGDRRGEGDALGNLVASHSVSCP